MAFRLVFLNPRAVWASSIMAVFKKGGFGFVNSYRAINSTIEKAPVVLPNQKADMAQLRGAHWFGKLDMLKGFW